MAKERLQKEVRIEILLIYFLTLSLQIDHVKENIQALTRGANPLGKCVDFVPEGKNHELIQFDLTKLLPDIESMDKELEMLKAENIKQTQLAEEEERLTEQSLQPFYSKLNELDQQIKEQLGKINNTKAKLIENDRAIAQMLCIPRVERKGHEIYFFDEIRYGS